MGAEPWWVANNAGLALADVSEHELAVAWLARGIEVAIAGDDPERLVAQMCDLRRGSLERLGRPPDELQRDGEAFADEARRRLSAHEDRSRMITDALTGSTAAGSAAIAMAWFPEAEYERALAPWPDALERFAGVEHRDYCRAIEVDMHALAGAGVRVSHAAPVTVAALTAHAASLEVDPASPTARAGIAAELVRRGQATAWPPGRNDRCWCGRPAKYKRCCGTVDADPSVLHDTAAAARMLRRLTDDPWVPDVVDARRRSPTAAARAELDQFAADRPATPGAPDPELEDEFADFVSDALYPHFLEVARRSPDAPLDQLLNEVAEVLAHDLVRGSLRRSAGVRLCLAGAIAAEGRPAVASELAESALAALETEGERPDTIAIALATTYLVDIGRREEALQRYHALLAGRPAEAGLIGEIAGEALCDRGYHLESAALAHHGPRVSPRAGAARSPRREGRAGETPARVGDGRHRARSSSDSASRRRARRCEATMRGATRRAQSGAPTTSDRPG